MKGNDGYIYETKNGGWVARITYTDPAGRRRNVKRTAESKSRAKDLLKALSLEIQSGKYDPDACRKTFDQLANFYQKTYLIEPIYVDGAKVAGLRDWKGQRGLLTILRGYFGKRLLRSIKYSHIEAFKRETLAQPTRSGGQKSLARVHRILALLRSMMIVAEREDWIEKSPFTRGKPLINLSVEKKGKGY